MPRELERRYGLGHDHFVTFSCYRRLPYLGGPLACSVFEEALERMRRRYEFNVDAYVIMPEHVHLLVSEPKRNNLSVALQALKISVSKRLAPKPFWQDRFYDFNVFTDYKRLEKRRYIHRNPVTRGLVPRPEDWKWSSYCHWAYGRPSIVEIESTWTFAARMQQVHESLGLHQHPANPHLKKRDVGHPHPTQT